MKLYCPILTIGFAPPEKNETDMRRCTEACAWFDKENNQCALKTCAETLAFISGQLDDSLALASGMFVPFEEDENFDYDPNTINASN